MRLALAAVAVLALTACAPEVPDSARGVGFESYTEYMKRRDAELAGGQASPINGPVISTERVGTGYAAPLDPAPLSSGSIASGPITSGSITSGPVAAGPVAAAPLSGIATGPLASDRPRGDTIAGVAQQTGEMARAGGASISDEQNFDAVASRESIESDKERLARQREQYVVIEPTALPQRGGASGPNIVEFALATQHAPGTQVYRRSGIRLTSYERACGRFTSADLAQEGFLASGGPDRDPKGLDPDGDGFACGWDPRPFRAALQ